MSKRIDGLFNIGLFYFKWWSALWSIYGVLCILGSLAFKIYFPDNPKVMTLFILSLVIFIKNALYLKISFCFRDIYLDKEKLLNFKISGFCFVTLFFIDMASFLRGDSVANTKSGLIMFAQILPSDAWITKIYLDIYRYIPAVYDFMNPQLQGMGLFIIGICLLSVSKGFRLKNIDEK